MKDEHKLFMNIAELFAQQSTCNRAMVGSVLVRDGRIISVGYNGSLPKQPHCSDIGHLMFENHCIRTVHSEMNTIIFAAKNGIDTKGAVLYTTHYPCLHCTKMLLGAGVKKVFYRTPYRMDENPFKHLMPSEKVE